jgi:hypothetical protein
MRETQPLPVVARQAAWDRLWRILLAPPTEDQVPVEPAEVGDTRIDRTAR